MENTFIRMFNLQKDKKELKMVHQRIGSFYEGKVIFESDGTTLKEFTRFFVACMRRIVEKQKSCISCMREERDAYASCFAEITKDRFPKSMKNIVDDSIMSLLEKKNQKLAELEDVFYEESKNVLRFIGQSYGVEILLKMKD
jgi:hypothetical protein